MPCCSTYKCFSAPNKELRSNMRAIISVPNRRMRGFPDILHCSNHGWRFKYGGNFVWFNFLLESFRLSRNLQSSVKKDMSESVAGETQMPTLRSFSQERAQQVPVTLQTVKAPGLTYSSDAAAQPDIHHPVRICSSHSRSTSCPHSP